MGVIVPSAVRERKLKIAFGELVGLVGGVEAAASDCRVSKSTIARYASLSPADAECFAPVDVVRALEAVAGQAVITAELVNMADGVFIKVPSVTRPADLFAALSDLSREASELTTAICAGFNDGKFCDVDAAKALSECNDVIQRAAQMGALLDTIIGDKE
jgi:hypothetical protein